MFLHEAAGQGWLQIFELVSAFVLSALIGLEREMQQKAAGLRTYTLVGVASALFMLVSKYGFMDVISPYRVVVDPSRIAAQVVSGIGFIGGGVIFVRSDIVKGLTTAASVWLVAAVGMACGAGMAVLAILVVFLYFLAIFGFPVLFQKLPRSQWSHLPLVIYYEDGHGALRDILLTCTNYGFSVSKVQVGGIGQTSDVRQRKRGHNEAETIDAHTVVVSMSVSGGKQLARLLQALSGLPAVLSVSGPDEGGE